MLVDGAIVVAEYADKRLEEGDEPREAYAAAARRMFWPIVSSTATTLCAFLPMLLWPGMPGQFMSQLPITLIFVLSASLLVALIYLPVLGASVGALAASIGRVAAAIDRALGGVLGRLAARFSRPKRPRAARAGLFGRFIWAIVGNPVGPVIAIAGAVAAVIGAFMLYGQYGKGVEFFVKTEPERANVYVRALGNLSLDEQDRLLRRVEREVLEVEGVSAVFAFSGVGGLTQEGGDAPQDAIGQLQLELSPWQGRLLRADPLFGDEVLAEIDRRIKDQPGVIAEVLKQKEGPQQGKPIQLELSSNDYEALQAAAARMRARFRRRSRTPRRRRHPPAPGHRVALPRRSRRGPGASAPTCRWWAA